MKSVAALRVVSEKDQPISYSMVEVSIDRIRAFSAQPRKWFDPEEIKARAKSLRATGQQCAVTVERVHGDPEHDYELVDGESRLRSARAAGLLTLWAMVRSRPFASRADKHLASLVANFNRSEHAPMEISDALHLQVTEGGKTQAELADALGKTDFYVSAYLSLQKLHPDIKARLHPAIPERKRLSSQVGFELARVPRDRQRRILEAAADAEGRVTRLRVQIEVERAFGLREKRKQSPAKRREKILNTLRAIRLDMEKLQAAVGADSAELIQLLRESVGGERRTIEDSIDALQSVHAVLWTPEREARHRAHHEANPDHVAQLRSGIALFRQMLEGRSTAAPMGDRRQLHTEGDH